MQSVTADHVWHFSVTSFSLLHQLCTVTDFYMIRVNIFLFVNELNNAHFTRKVILKQFWDLRDSLLQLLFQHDDFCQHRYFTW